MRFSAETPMNDHISEEELAAYIEGTIAPKMRPAIERHLTGCDRCLGDLADLAEILRPPVPVPDDLLKAALSRFPAGRKEAKRRRFLLPNRWALQVAALFAVALLLGYLLIVEHPPVASIPQGVRNIGPGNGSRRTSRRPPAADQKEIPSSLPAPAKIEKKSASRRTQPSGGTGEGQCPVREKDELRLSREEESGKQKEAFSVSRQVRLDAQKGQLSKGPHPSPGSSRSRTRRSAEPGSRKWRPSSRSPSTET